MFTLDNFWQILNFLDGTSSLLLDSNTKVLAPSEQGVTNQLFENTIDQIVFASDDYKRLKRFLVNWYASHRTMISTQKNANDVFSLPENQLDELLHSFGFTFATTPLSFLTKANFFLDLVNLYKVKGTPQTLIDVLQYFGLSDIDLAEYWLEKDDGDNLIFRSERYLPSGVLDIDFANIDFNVMTRNDPHWRLSETQIRRLLELNKIGFPSKSPYFSIRPRYNLTLLRTLMSVVQRHVQDDYNTYASGGTLSRDVKLTEINIYASFLELYLSCCYTFNELYDHTDSSDDRFYCYDGTSVLNIDKIEDQWENRTKRLTSPLTENVSRETWNSKMDSYYDLFTRNMVTNFFDTNDPGTLLNVLNSNLYDVLNAYISSGNGSKILSYLLKDLNDWIGLNIGYGYPNIATTMLGIESLIEINKIIKFFKPYHARLVGLEFALIEQNPLADSLVMEDSTGPLGITDIYVDFDVADSSPCCGEDSTSGQIVDCSDSTSLNCSRETYDCGSYFDIGASIDQGDEVDLEMIEGAEDYQNFHDATSSNAYEQLLYVDTTNFDSTASICDGSGVLAIQLIGGWADMDENGVFDGEAGSDIVEIYMEDIGCTSPPGPPVPGTAWSTTTSMVYARSKLGGFGDVDDAIAIGGVGPGVTTSEKYGSNVWATTSSQGEQHWSMACCGNTSDGFSTGGNRGSRTARVRRWDGNVWTNTNSLNIAREEHGGCGVTSNMLVFGGTTDSGYPSATATTEIWNGSWTTTGVLNEMREMTSGCGTTTGALCAGGTTYGSWDNHVEIWNGSTWATTTSLNIAQIRELTSFGTTQAAMTCGGHTMSSYTNKAEIWDGSTWATTSGMNQSKYNLTSTDIGVSTALSFGGYAGSSLSTVEKWS